MQDETAPTRPRTLRDAANVAARRAMLSEPHIAPLAAYVSALRASATSWEFPEFDPMDGGVRADILFLFEKPGPKTSAAGGGSGFISRDNDDPTADATFKFMLEAGIARKRSVTWNVIPGWNGTRAITPTELRNGVSTLGELLKLLPRVRSIVLVGRRAQRASGLIDRLGIPTVVSAHPSPLVRASRPEEWQRIANQWNTAIPAAD